MPIEQLLEAVERLLERERVAIVELDAETIELTAADKEGLFSALQAATLTAQHGPQLARIADAAKQNCLLLANARELAKQTVASLAREVNGAALESGATAVSGQPGPSANRRGVRLSITG
jgi:hypothetical protein